MSKREILKSPVIINDINVVTKRGKIKFNLLTVSTTIMAIANVLFILAMNAPVPQKARRHGFADG